MQATRLSMLKNFINLELPTFRLDKGAGDVRYATVYGREKTEPTILIVFLDAML
jgi:hypothetical protein